MEGGCNDPYEQQLLTVYESCLGNGQEGLEEDGLRALCDKLQLEERGKELISCLLEQTPVRKSVSFYEFRDGLLALLGKSQEGVSENTKSGFAGDSLQTLNASQFAHKNYGCKLKAKDDAVDFHRTNLDENLDFRKLRTLWSQVSSGMDGNINCSELCALSHCIGIPTLPRQTIERVFEKLDMNHDGLINLEDFLLLFQNEKLVQEHLDSGWDDGLRNSVTKQESQKDSVHILGPHHTGFAESSTIVDMWEVAGIPDAATLLSDLGFSGSTVSLTELTNVLCEELKSLCDESDNRIMGTHISLLKAALVLYQEEVRTLNTLMEHLGGERDKLRINIAEANERARLLAQEVDEHHVQLENSSQNQLKQLELKHAEATKDLTNQLGIEREANAAALKLMDQRLQTLQLEDQRIRVELANVLQENQTLEIENQSFCDQITKLKVSNNQLQMKVQMLAAEHDEVENVEAREHEQVISLIDRIKHLQSEASVLRDQNDELKSELEILKGRDSTVKNTREREVLQNSAGKRTLPDETEGQDDTHDTAALIARVAELERLLKQFECSAFKEVEPTRSLANELEAECEERTSESLRDLVINKNDKLKLGKRMSNSDDTIHNIDKNFNNLDVKSHTMKNKMTSLRDYPPRKDENFIADQPKVEKDKNSNSHSLTMSNDKLEAGRLNVVRQENVQDRDMIKELLGEQEVQHASERKQLTERCIELERSLDLLRAEYEQCEDYWAGKLEEERQLFEQEQKVSDEKFSDLIAKMAEYEEQFGTGDKGQNDGRLSPIEERFNLEQQYTDLEDEYHQWRVEAEEKEQQKDKEIQELREKLQAKSQISTSDFSTQYPEYEVFNYPQRFVPSSNFVSPEASCSNDSSVTGILDSLTPPKMDQGDFESKKSNDSFRLSKNAEVTLPTDGLSFPRRVKATYYLHGCNCYQIETYSSAEELCRAHREELRRLHQKKVHIDTECNSLMKQKEMLMQEILKLQSIKAVTCYCTPVSAGEQACRIDINVLQALNTRLQAQEQKCRHLQTLLKQQQQHTERILHQTWKQHRSEVTDLQFVLKNAQDKLQQQMQLYKEQADRLARSDMLAKDLYVENAYLIATVERLEQHCHMLTHCSAESTSV